MPPLKQTFRRLYYALLFILFFNFTHAQTDINTSFADRMNYIFQSLEKPRVPNGLLLDYAMEFTNLSNFNGTALTDSNKVMTSEFYEIYNTLYLSRIHPNGFTIQNPSTFDSSWFSQRAYGKIVLAGLFYNYSKFKDDAVQNSLITVQNEQVLDRYVNGEWQNPYQTEKVFAVSPSIEFYEGKNLQVVLPSNLWQTNASGEVSNINIDFDDGQGYRTLTIGQPLTLNYTDTGSKEWKYRLQLSNGQYLYSHSRVKIKNAIVETGCANCRFGTSNPEVLQFTADEAFQGAMAKGFITIQYRDADLGLRRPLIVAEGFDAGHITSPELRFGTSTIFNFYRNVDVQTSGSQSIDDVIRNFPEYDIIYVDWANGTDYLQRNGLLLETIIRWVNANKEPLPGGGFADNVILGQSMGGVVTRWALRDMETRLVQQHQTRMFISMDAPQQGANVPASYQHLARHLRNLYLQTNVWGGVELFQWVTGGPSPFRVLSLADQPASKQMLINWVNASGSIDNTVHNQWETELQNLGYPSQNNIRNIAISNGAECGTTQPFAPGAELLNINGKANTRFLGDLAGQVAFPLAGALLGQGGFYLGILPGRNDINYEFIANAQPQQGTSQRIYHGKISFTKKVLWLIPVTVTITERNNNNNSGLLPIDYYAGGEINTGVDVDDIDFHNALVKFNINFSHIPTFSFVPTPSALDIGSNNVTLTNTDYLARYIGGAPPAAPKNTPFQNFVTAFNNERKNEQHIGFFQRNGDWLAQELTQSGNPPPNLPVANCNVYCGISINGASEICNSSQTYSLSTVLPTGASVSWSASPSGIVSIAPSGNNVNLTQVSYGTVTLTAIIATGSDCGTLSVLKNNITVGGPVVNFTVQPFDPNQQFCTNSFGNSIQVQPQPISGVTGFQWGYSSSQNGIPPTVYHEHGTYDQDFIFSRGGQYQIYARAENACGLGTTETLDIFVSNNCSGGGLDAFTVSPNPTNGDMQITSTDDKGSVKEIRVTDKTGAIRKRFFYKVKARSVNINISSLPVDLYYLQISDGSKWITKPISKQ